MILPAKSAYAQLALPFGPAADPEELFARVYRRVRPGKNGARFTVTFREWAHPRSTIREEAGGYRVEIFDVLRDAPSIVIEALAEILIMRYHRRRPSCEARACYLAHTLSPAVRQRINEARRMRGFKHVRPPSGRHYDLEEIFNALNREFFQEKLRISQIGWSARAATTILGHHDPAHETIVINRVLDSPKVPRGVVESVVYHEMLHIVFPIERDHHRRVIHSSRFREMERKFPGYTEAQRFLKSEGWAVV